MAQWRRCSALRCGARFTQLGLDIAAREQRTPEGLAPSTRPRSRNGGRSSSPPTSRGGVSERIARTSERTIRCCDAQSMSDMGQSETKNDVCDNGSFSRKRSPAAGGGCTAGHCQPGLILVARLAPIADAGAGDRGICNEPISAVTARNKGTRGSSCVTGSRAR
jgi:hypothetical protein